MRRYLIFMLSIAVAIVMFLSISTTEAKIKTGSEIKKISLKKLKSRKIKSKKKTKAQPAPLPASSSSSSQFVGNKSSKLLHNLAHGSCQDYVNRMNESNKVFFSSEAAGIAAGYKPCAKCN